MGLLLASCLALDPLIDDYSCVTGYAMAILIVAIIFVFTKCHCEYQ